MKSSEGRGRREMVMEKEKKSLESQQSEGCGIFLLGVGWKPCSFKEQKSSNSCSPRPSAGLTSTGCWAAGVGVGTPHLQPPLAAQSWF